MKSSLGWLFVLIPLTLAACDSKPPQPAAAPAPAASAAAGTPTDWSKVAGASGEAAVDAWSRLSRCVDVWHKGAGATLTFANGKATDAAGHSIAMKAEEWKGVLDLIDRSPDHKTPTRAEPGRNYGDGLGSAKRFAYSVERTPDGKLIFTVVKQLEGESSG